MEQQSAGWIDVSVCEALLSKSLSFVCAVDGSDPSMMGFHLLTEGILQQKRDSCCEVLHVFDETKSDSDLRPSCRPDAIRSLVEARLASAVSQKRYGVKWLRKEGAKAGTHLCKRAQDRRADFVIMGFSGRKRRRDRGQIASNCQLALERCSASVIVLKDEEPELLPIRRPCKFVVSVSLNKASTKAFLDALRLSQPGDEIHVVYVKSYMERTDSDYTRELREKYSAFFSGLQESESQAFSRFHDRRTGFVMIKKQLRETTAQAVVRYGDEIEADFMVVGTNTLRTQRGKKPIGSVSLDICMEWERNFVVSHWVDIAPRLYDRYGTAHCLT